MKKPNIISIEYEPTPKVKIRTIGDNDTDFQKKSKTRYPFELRNKVTIIIKTDTEDFSFDILKGFVWDGATIPKVVWSLVGSATENDFLIPSLVHDYILESKNYIMHNTLHCKYNLKEYIEITSDIFYNLLLIQGVNKNKARIMSWFVNTYQLHFNHKNKKGN